MELTALSLEPAHATAPKLRIVVSSANAERLEAARAFVAALPAGSEALLLGAHREAVDDLAREITVQGTATFGLRRASLTQLASGLALEDLARRGLAPASGLGAHAVAARAAFEAMARGLLPRLAAMVEFPGFPRAVARTLAELRAAGLAYPPSDGSDETRELLVLLAGYREALDRAGLADRTTLLEAATLALEKPEHQALREAPMLLLDVSVTGRAERAFLAALLGDCPHALVVVPAGDAESLDALSGIPGAEIDLRPESGPESSLSRLRAHLFSDEPPPAGDLDEAVGFFSAPGEARECVEVARRIGDQAERSVPFDRIAILVRSPELYATHLESALARAGIPAWFARGTRRPDPSGRALLALLACKAEGLSARRFAEYLSFAQVPDLDPAGAPPAGREIWVPARDESAGPAAGSEAQLAFDFTGGATPEPAPRLELDADEHPTLGGALRAPWKWEEYLVEAAVIGGRDRWERRLRGLEAEMRLQRDALAAAEPDSSRIVSLDRDLVQLGHLERFALPLIAELDALPDSAEWSKWLAALERLTPMALIHPERALAVLAEMRPMAEVGPAGLEEVRVVLTPRLSMLEQEPPPHRYGRVYVGTPEQARGRSFDTVFVVGLAERLFPQRPREDPLLLDHARQALSAELVTQEQRAQRERLMLRLAVGAAERRVVLSYPRMEVSEARPRVPSFYGLDVIRAVRGEIPHHEELERSAAREGSARLAWPAPDDPARALDPVEHDLAVLGPLFREPASQPGRARYLFDLNPHLARSLRSRWVRWERSWRPQDGIVRGGGVLGEILGTHRLARRAFSATGLQRFSVCPYQFLLGTIHRLEPRRQAVPLIQLDPLTRGSMFHEIQAAFLGTLQRGGLLPITADRLEEADRVLDRVVTEISSRYQDDLAPAIPRVWHDEVRAMRADLRVNLRRMSEQSASWMPIRFELTFGLPAAVPGSPPELPDPVTLDGGFLLHGAVDLLEESADGTRLRVTDYKTGVNRTRPDNLVAGGERLQPVLYSLAVEKALGRPVEEARLSFCTARGGFTEHVVPMNAFARQAGSTVLTIIDGAIAQGMLAPAPKAKACGFCDFRVVCGPWEEQRLAKKDPRPLEHLERLREIR